jgi:hypothetical protein
MSAGEEDWIDAVAAELAALGVLDPPLHEALLDALRAAEAPAAPGSTLPAPEERGGVRVLAGGRNPGDPEAPFADPPRLRLVTPDGSDDAPSAGLPPSGVRLLQLRGPATDAPDDGVFDVEPGETQVLQWRRRATALRVYCEMGDAELHVDGAVLALHEGCSADVEGKIVKVTPARGAHGEPTLGRYRSLRSPSRRPPSSS